MRAGSADNRRGEHGSGTTRARRPRGTSLALAAASAAVLAAAATLTVVIVQPASASTLNGIATIASPGTTNYLLSGASTTPFTVSLPSQAACSGDSVHGYHVWSYLVPQGTVMSTVSFTNNHPSVGVGVLNSSGKYYGPVDTAITTGLIYGIPNNFEWAPVVTVPRISLSGLLYSGSSGVWEAGLACANSSGTLTDNWNTEVTFTASSTDTNGFTWSAVPGPSGSAPASFTSASSTTFTVGSPGTFTPAASGPPMPTITNSGGALPAGVTFSGGSLSGTATQDGSFPITFTATNGIEAPAIQSFTLIVDQAPAITSAATDTVTTGGPIIPFMVTATGYPAPTFGSTGNLDGLSLDPVAGVLSGTPTASGTFPITITATNGIGSPASQQFTLTVSSSPVITSAPSATFTEGSAGTFTVTANGVPAPTFGSTGNLDGLSLDPTSGVLSGTPTQDGSYPVTITATNGVSPDASQSFTLIVDQHPAITSAATVTFIKGTAGTFQVTATGYPAPTLSVTGTWPRGLQFNPTTGVLSGTATATGVVTVTLHAANGVRPEASQSFTVRVVALEVTTVSLPVVTRGTPYATTLTALGGTHPYTWTLIAGRIPRGLLLAPTGELYGTARASDTAGTRNLTVQVTDRLHDTATAVLRLVVQ